MNLHLSMRLAFAVLALFISFQSLAQQTNGNYFITLQGDTIHAYIYSGGDWQNTYGFKYKSSDKDGSFQVLKPKDTREVTFDDEK
jgi:hypothetical protein